MNFNLGTTASVIESTGTFLQPGIHKAKFNGITRDVITGKDGNNYNVMVLNLDVEGYGEFTHNFFEPTSEERTSSAFGENPSSAEQFLISLRQILETVDPTICEGIDNGSIKISGSFDQIVNKCHQLTKDKIGKELEVKLLPNKNGFASIPQFPAKITRSGALAIGVKFIGDKLTLSPSEVKKIEAAKNAKPTDMKKTISNEAKDLLADLGADLGSDDSSDDNDSDLPF